MAPCCVQTSPAAPWPAAGVPEPLEWTGVGDEWGERRVVAGGRERLPRAGEARPARREEREGAKHCGTAL